MENINTYQDFNKYKNFDLKDFRKQNKITQTALAKILGISRSTITKIEGKEIKLSVKVYNLIQQKWKN
jgi:DNA-binding XRE family transcriptional regulator